MDNRFQFCAIFTILEELSYMVFKKNFYIIGTPNKSYMVFKKNFYIIGTPNKFKGGSKQVLHYSIDKYKAYNSFC